MIWRYLEKLPGKHLETNSEVCVLKNTIERCIPIIAKLTATSLLRRAVGNRWFALRCVMENSMLAVSKIHLILIFTNTCKRNFIYNRAESPLNTFFPNQEKYILLIQVSKPDEFACVINGEGRMAYALAKHIF